MPQTIHSQNSQKLETITTNTQVDIFVNAPAIQIKAVTPRLILRSVEPSDVPDYQAIFADPVAMSMFGQGIPLLYKNAESEAAGIVDYAQNRLVDDPNSWCKRWAQGNPYSAMTMLEQSTQSTIGCIVIGSGEMAYFIDQKYWGKGYGSEAAIAMTRAILPALVLSQVSNDAPTSIAATAHPENIASCKILEGIGMTQDPSVSEVNWNGKTFPRNKYEISVQDLVADYQRIKSTRSDLRQAHSKPLLPLYRLHKSSENGDTFNVINKGGYSLRSTEDRKKRYSI